MLGMDLFRNQADKIRADHDKRGIPHDRIDRVIELDEQWREALKEMEESRRQRNQAARHSSHCRCGSLSSTSQKTRFACRSAASYPGRRRAPDAPSIRTAPGFASAVGSGRAYGRTRLYRVRTVPLGYCVLFPARVSSTRIRLYVYNYTY